MILGVRVSASLLPAANHELTDLNPHSLVEVGQDLRARRRALVVDDTVDLRVRTHGRRLMQSHAARG